MTTRAVRPVHAGVSGNPRASGLRVIGGRAAGRPQIGPFVVFGLVVVASMLGIVMARTSLDAGAFQLNDLNSRIAAEQDRQDLLTLRIAELESPTRISPMAEEMGLVYPESRTVLLIDGIEDPAKSNNLLVESSNVDDIAMGDQP